MALTLLTICSSCCKTFFKSHNNENKGEQGWFKTCGSQFIRPDSSVIPKPSWERYISRTSSLTRPAWQTVALPGVSLAAVGMNTITPLQAARPKRAHLHNEQVPTGKELSGESPPHSVSPVRVRQNTTLAMCCCVDSLVGWHCKDKRGTFPKCRLKHTEGEVRDSKLDTSTGCLITKRTHPVELSAV